MAKKFQDFLNALGQKESSGSYTTVNRANYLGKYQFGEAALTDAGFYKTDSTPKTNDWQSKSWTGKMGITSKAAFLASPAAQEAAIQTLMDKQHTYIKDILQYDGQTLNGVALTVSGMLAGAHLVGWSKVVDFVKGGCTGTPPVDGNKTSVVEYITKFGGYDTPWPVDHTKGETLNGGGGEDVLHGYGGDDFIYGNAKHDMLYGDDGRDTLIGGLGQDVMYGGKGADTFRFTSLEDSKPGYGIRDAIGDFNRSEGDRIDLSRLDANSTKSGQQHFSPSQFLGNAAFHKIAGEWRYENNVLEADVNGDGKADFQILIIGPKTLWASDFIF